MISARLMRPLTDLTENSQLFLAELKQDQEPVLLTVAGKAELVVQSPEAYQKLLNQIETLETREAIREGFVSIERGEGRPADEVFAEIKAELLSKESQ